jgi:spore maturation protein CgeB
MTDAQDWVLFNFSGRHPGLAEGFAEIGVPLRCDLWNLSTATLQGCRLALIDATSAVRQPWRCGIMRRQLRQAGIPLILLDRDAPWHKGLRWHRLALFRAVAGADVYATHSLQGCANFPYPSLYLPNAVRTSQYHLHGATLQEMRMPDWYLWDVAIIGNLAADRHPEHAGRVARLQMLAEQLSRRVRFVDPRHLAPKEDIEIIQRSRINLQLGAAADDIGPVSWGLPERCYGIPACGGFLLSDKRLHATDDFRSDSEWAEFDLDAENQDLLRQIRRFADDLPAARAIAEAAHRRVMLDHSYARRAVRLLVCATRLGESP